MKKLFFPFFLAMFTLVFVACEKDDDPKELSATEAKVVLNSSSVSLETEFKEMENMAAMKALDKVSDMKLPFSAGEDDLFMVKQYVSELDEQPSVKLTAKKSEENKEFSQLVGTYTYDATNARWSIDANNPDDKIVVIFPTEGSSKNNATWTIYALETVKVVDDMDVNYEPTKIKMDLVIDDKKVLDFNLNAEWGEGSDPESMSYALEVPPYKDELSMSMSKSAAEFSRTFSKGGTSLASIGVGAVFEGMQEEDGEPIPSSMSGHIQYGAVKVEGSVDFEEIMKVILNPVKTDQEAALAEVNENIKITVSTYPGKEKIGIIQLDIIAGEEEPVQVIVFNDGTKERADKYLKSMMDQLEEIFDDVDDEEDDFFS